MTRRSKRRALIFGAVFALGCALYQVGQLGMAVSVLAIIGMLWIAVEVLATNDGTSVRSFSNFARGAGSIIAFLLIAALVAKCSKPDGICVYDPEACQVSP